MNSRAWIFLTSLAGMGAMLLAILKVLGFGWGEEATVPDPVSSTDVSSGVAFTVLVSCRACPA